MTSPVSLLSAVSFLNDTGLELVDALEDRYARRECVTECDKFTMTRPPTKSAGSTMPVTGAVWPESTVAIASPAILAT